ncbi:hypothetical protein MNV49_006268 [Pseudohyphozyma bogoriensis]|nr:hypothetical protein MNV49_006268 [Pseudohyphozyma bogoriensis]
MTTKRPVSTTPEEWKTRLADVPVSKDDLNALVANYLFTEGFRDAAENFSREAGITPAIDLPSIESRQVIRRAVHSGEVEKATELVNELDPEILDTNPTLHFHLLQLHLIELIRQSRIPEALLFAQTELAPRGEEHPQFLKELERTMALLAFEMPAFPSSAASAVVPAPPPSGKKAKEEVQMPSSISSLLDQSQRLKTAAELNAAILTSQSHNKEPKLPGLMKMLGWGEGLLSEKGAEYPRWKFHEMLRERKEERERGGDPEEMVI